MTLSCSLRRYILLLILLLLAAAALCLQTATASTVSLGLALRPLLPNDSLEETLPRLLATLHAAAHDAASHLSCDDSSWSATALLIDVSLSASLTLHTPRALFLTPSDVLLLKSALAQTLSEVPGVHILPKDVSLTAPPEAQKAAARGAAGRSLLASNVVVHFSVSLRTTRAPSVLAAADALEQALSDPASELRRRVMLSGLAESASLGAPIEALGAASVRLRLAHGSRGPPSAQEVGEAESAIVDAVLRALAESTFSPKLQLAAFAASPVTEEVRLEAAQPPPAIARDAKIASDTIASPIKPAIQPATAQHRSIYMQFSILLVLGLGSLLIFCMALLWRAGGGRAGAARALASLLRRPDRSQPHRGSARRTQSAPHPMSKHGSELESSQPPSPILESVATGDVDEDLAPPTFAARLRRPSSTGLADSNAAT